MVHPAFLYVLLLLAGFVAQVACAQNLAVQSAPLPVVEGKINGMDVVAQGDSVAFFAGKLPDGYNDESCVEDLHCAMHKNYTRAVMISPEGVVELFISTEEIEPTPTLATLYTGNPVLDQTPGLAWVNSKTMKLPATTVETMNLLSTSTSSSDFDEFTLINPSPTETVKVRTTITGELDELRKRLMSSATVSVPTPVRTNVNPPLWENDEILSETETDIFTIRPSPSGQYARRETGSFFTFTVKQAGTTSANEGSKTSTGSSINPGPEVQASPTAPCSYCGGNTNAAQKGEYCTACDRYLAEQTSRLGTLLKSEARLSIQSHNSQDSAWYVLVQKLRVTDSLTTLLEEYIQQQGIGESSQLKTAQAEMLQGIMGVPDIRQRSLEANQDVTEVERVQPLISTTDIKNLLQLLLPILNVSGLSTIPTYAYVLSAALYARTWIAIKHPESSDSKQWYFSFLALCIGIYLNTEIVSSGAQLSQSQEEFTDWLQRACLQIAESEQLPANAAGIDPTLNYYESLGNVFKPELQSDLRANPSTIYLNQPLAAQVRAGFQTEEQEGYATLLSTGTGFEEMSNEMFSGESGLTNILRYTPPWTRNSVSFSPAV